MKGHSWTRIDFGPKSGCNAWVHLLQPRSPFAQTASPVVWTRAELDQ